jgi:hypothetical protein
MTQHKWHKEIKAWADGAEIEFYHSPGARWINAPDNPDWSGNIKYRIKPQPKEPKYLYVVLQHNGFVRLATSNAVGGYEVLMGKIEVDDD